MARKDYIQGILLSFILFCVCCVDCENVATGTNYTLKAGITGRIDLGDWRYNGNLVVEWDIKNKVLDWYRFQDRAKLNLTNGDLSVVMKKEDSGVFKAQFQVKRVLQYSEMTIKVIDPLTKPEVTCCVDCENFKTGTNYTFKPAIPGAIELGYWRLNGNLVVEWDVKSVPVWYRLKGRAQLNTDNGDLTVWLNKEDSGIFMARFQVQGVLQYFERTIKVIDQVTKPKVTCEQNDLDITLKCSVDDPVQALFTWSGPDGFSHVGDSVQITRKQNDDSIYYCSAKNEESVMSAEFKLKDQGIRSL